MALRIATRNRLDETLSRQILIDNGAEQEIEVPPIPDSIKSPKNMSAGSDIPTNFVNKSTNPLPEDPTKVTSVSSTPNSVKKNDFVKSQQDGSILFKIALILFIVAAVILVVAVLLALVSMITHAPSLLPSLAVHCGFGLTDIIIAGTALSANTAGTLAGLTVAAVPTTVLTVTGTLFYLSGQGAASEPIGSDPQQAFNV